MISAPLPVDQRSAIVVGERGPPVSCTRLLAADYPSIPHALQEFRANPRCLCLPLLGELLSSNFAIKDVAQPTLAATLFATIPRAAAGLYPMHHIPIHHSQPENVGGCSMSLLRLATETAPALFVAANSSIQGSSPKLFNAEGGPAIVIMACAISD